MERPYITMRGPVLNAPDVAMLARFYERFLGWRVRALEGPGPGKPSGDGWAQLFPADDSTKIEIQWDEHYVRPVWPGEAGAQGMQMHLDFRVEDVAAAVEWALACGATQATHQPPNRDPTRLRVMLDPAGHPFCLFS